MHLDVKTTFLQSTVEEDIFKQPQGYIKKDSSETPSLYGLKQSPKNWYNTIHATLLELELKPCLADPLIKVTENASVILILYVDDIIITGSSNINNLAWQGRPALQFSMFDLGAISVQPGIEINRKR
ncbi:unnamed protein product [Discosporangium mesarthrocarpum]